MRRSCFILAGLALAVSSAALAQQGAQFTDKGSHPSSMTSASGVDQAALARDLAEYGVHNDMPLALVTAARILLKSPVTASTDHAQSGANKGTAPAAGSRQDTQEPALDPAALLAAAKGMVHDDPHVQMLIDEMTSQLPTSTRGATGGPVVRNGRVEVGQYNWYNIMFNGSENAHVVVDGDGTTDLDCYAYAQDGSLIDSDTDLTDYCVLDWFENWTGTVRVEIHNLGNVYNDYVLITN